MSDFDSLFGNASLKINCPKCNTEVSFILSDVGKTIKCPKCSTLINLAKDDSFDEQVESVNDALKDFEDTLNNFGK